MSAVDGKYAGIVPLSSSDVKTIVKVNSQGLRVLSLNKTVEQHMLPKGHSFISHLTSLDTIFSVTFEYIQVYLDVFNLKVVVFPKGKAVWAVCSSV